MPNSANICRECSILPKLDDPLEYEEDYEPSEDK
jgi:hypothetical protein